ncbi:hypothetical protein D9M68_449680 [compost metagenome]
MELQVGPALAGGVDETAALDHVRREQAGAEQHPLQPVLQRRQAAVVAQQAHGLARAAVDRHLEVVLEVLAHAGQVFHHRQAQRLQLRAGADAREQQQLGRGERAGREDHFVARGGHHLFAAAVAARAVDHAGGRAVLREHAQHVRARHHGELRVVAHGREVGGGGARAPAFEGGGLVEAHAGLGGAVEVVVVGQAALLRGAQEGQAQRMAKARVAHLQRPVRAVQLAGEARVALGLAEPRQHVAPAPAFAALRLPAVVVGGRAAHVDHGVDRTAAAQRAALRHEHLAAGGGGLRLALVGPGALGADHAHEGGGHVDEAVVVGRARLQQQHAAPGAHQPVRQHAAGRAGAHHHHIENLLRHVRSRLKLLSGTDARGWRAPWRIGAG